MTLSPQLKLFRTASIVLILIGISHPVIHFATRNPKNDTEEELFRQMAMYQKPMIGGEMSMLQLQDGLNICYGVFLLFFGVVNLYCFAQTDRDSSFIKGLSRIESMMFLACFVVSIIFFFWVPAVYLGLFAVGYAWCGMHRLKKMEYSYRNPRPLS